MELKTLKHICILAVESQQALEALIARSNALLSAYAVSIEQDNAGWGMLIDTDSASAGDPALVVTNPTGTLFNVTSSGFTGIGVTGQPARELEVEGAGNVYIRVTARTDNDSTAIELTNTQETWTIRNDDAADDALKFTSDSGTQLTITRTGTATFAGALSATTVGVTNIVTNFIPKFNGTIFDDSLLKDDGSTLTYDGYPIYTIKDFNNYAGRQIASDTLFEILESDDTATLRGKLNYYNSAVTRVDDSTAPAQGCFELNNKYASISIPGYFKVEAGQEYTFEVWVKFISGTDTDQRIYAGSSFYDASKTYLGNTQRYWGESGLHVDSDGNNDGWYFISGTLGPTVGTGTGNIPTSAKWMRLIMLLNYSNDANVIRLCGLRYYKSGGVGAKLHTSIYRKAIGSEAGTSAGAWLGRQVMDTSGNFYHPDNVKSYFGTSNDLEIYHDGSHSYITDVGTGDLTIRAGNDLRLQSPTTEAYLTCNQDSSVQIYYNNTEKFRTSSAGIDVLGDIILGDGATRSIIGATNQSLIINAKPNSPAEGLLFQINGTDKLSILEDGNATFAGNVGIGGSASSTHTLDLNSSSNLALRFFDSTTFKAGMQAVDTGGQMIATSAAGDFAIRSQSNMLFATGGNTERMRIDSSGHILMGKTSGSYRLDMETIAGGNAFRTTRGTSSFRIFQANNGASYLGTENNADLNIQTNATNRVIIGASGNSTFTGNVTVSSGTNRSIILDYTAGSGSYSLMSFKQSGTEQFRLWGDYTDNYLSFYNDQANLHQLKLNSDGSTTFGGNGSFYSGNTVTSLNVGGNYGKTDWTRSYVVSNTLIAPILDHLGNNIPDGGAYRVVGHIDGTGTDQSSMAVFWNQNGTWYCNLTAQSGTTSNHIQFLVSGGVPSVKTYHANNYTVRAYHERIILNESTTDNTRHYFGSDSFMQMIGSIINLNYTTVLNTDTRLPEHITHNGDTNTFFGFPNNDQFGVKTAGNYNIFCDASQTILYSAGADKFRTNSSGVAVNGNMTFGDNNFATFGASGDLRIYHNGSDSVIDTTTGSAGDLYLTANGSGHDLYLRAADNIYIQPQGGENGIICIGNGEVNIYHNSAKKIMTQSTGAIIYGELQLNDANTKLLEGTGNALRIQTNSGYVDIGPMNSSFSHFQTDRPQFYFNKQLSIDGNCIPYTNLAASLGGSSNIWNKTFTRYIESNAGAARVKFSVWSGLTYGYGMQAGYTYGALDNEYALTSQMSNTDGRGWWWGDNGHTNAQGAMSLNTRGRLTVATSVRLGYGEGDTTNVPSYALDVSGSIRATSDVIAFSDRRVKENIVTIDNALEKVTKLRGVSYTRKDIEDKSTKVGVIAQEVLKVLPEVVSIDDEDKHSVSYGNMAGCTY